MITPLYDRILIKRNEAETVSPGGILIPDNAKEKPLEGIVVACGEGRLLADGKIRPLAVQPKQTVLFGKYAGNEVKYQGETYTLLREDDVLAILS